MSVLLLDKQLVIARLQAEVAEPAKLRALKGAAGLAQAQADLRTTPAAFVVETVNRAGPNRTGTEVVVQENAARFAVILAVENKADPRGEASGDALRELRLKVITALLGWQPDADFDPCIYAGGQLLQMNDYTLWWQDEFITAAQLRSI